MGVLSQFIEECNFKLMSYQEKLNKKNEVMKKRDHVDNKFSYWQ